MEKINLDIEVESDIANLYKTMNSNQQKKDSSITRNMDKKSYHESNFLRRNDGKM
ncbi:MAG: hypothetical protein AB4063_12940 [Crocosphaera sp.]